MRKGFAIAAGVLVALGLLDVLVLRTGLSFVCFVAAVFVLWAGMVRWHKPKPKPDPDEGLPWWRYDKLDGKLLAPGENEYIGSWTDKSEDEVWRFRAKDRADAEARLADRLAHWPDPETVEPVDAYLCPLFRRNGYKQVCSMNALLVGVDLYVPAATAREGRHYATEDEQERTVRADGMRGLGFAKQCEACQGAGTKGENEDGPVPCGQCRGNRYSAWCSAPPADMVLIQPVVDGVDERFHAFVAAHRDEFNEYMRHVMLAGCYLADVGEKSVYARDLGKDFRVAIAADPGAELANMRAMKAAYGRVMSAAGGAEKNGKVWFQPRKGPFVDEEWGLKLTVQDFHWFKDRNSGEPRVSIVGSGYDTLYQLFAGGMDHFMDGSAVRWELHRNGEPCEDGKVRKVILTDRKSKDRKYDVELGEYVYPHIGPAARARGYASDKAGRPIVALRWPNVVGYEAV